MYLLLFTPLLSSVFTEGLSTGDLLVASEVNPKAYLTMEESFRMRMNEALTIVSSPRLILLIRLSFVLILVELG